MISDVVQTFAPFEPPPHAVPLVHSKEEEQEEEPPPDAVASPVTPHTHVVTPPMEEEEQSLEENFTQVKKEEEEEEEEETFLVWRSHRQQQEQEALAAMQIARGKAWARTGKVEFKPEEQQEVVHALAVVPCDPLAKKRPMDRKAATDPYIDFSCDE